MIAEGMRSFLARYGVEQPTHAMVAEAIRAEAEGTLDDLLPELLEESRFLSDPQVSRLLQALISAYDPTVPKGTPGASPSGPLERAVRREFASAVAAIDEFHAELG